MIGQVGMAVVLVFAGWAVHQLAPHRKAKRKR